MKIKRYNQFINESNNIDIIEQIKKFLISEDEYDYETWDEFIDNQEMGDCQLIVSIIVNNFSNSGVNKVFGEIEVDTPSKEYDEEYNDVLDDYEEIEIDNFHFTHHWIEINGQIYDFSKGTLQNNIEWNNLYDVCVDGEEWRYNGISN